MKISNKLVLIALSSLASGSSAFTLSNKKASSFALRSTPDFSSYIPATPGPTGAPGAIGGAGAGASPAGAPDGSMSWSSPGAPSGSPSSGASASSTASASAYKATANVTPSAKMQNPNASITYETSSNYANANRFLTPDKDGETFDIFPAEYDSVIERIDGGGTIRSCKLPSWATRVQYKIESFGRPCKGQVNLWLGPGRSTHTLKFDTESGVEFPIESVLKFKNGHDGAPVMKVSTTDDYCFPMKFSAHVPSPERAEELNANTEKQFYSATRDEKMVIQGSQTDGKQGAWRYWNIPQEVEAIQLLGWSVDTGKKSFKVQVELLQGPNNLKQSLFLQCGGGSQPYHTVIQTPGSGWTVRIQNKKFMEDGLTQMCVLPYEHREKEDSDLFSWSAEF